MRRTGLAKTHFPFSNTFAIGTCIPLVLEYRCPNTFDFEYMWVVYREGGVEADIEGGPGNQVTRTSVAPQEGAGR